MVVPPNAIVIQFRSPRMVCAYTGHTLGVMANLQLHRQSYKQDRSVKMTKLRCHGSSRRGWEQNVQHRHRGLDKFLVD